ncbi:hypothetical protein THRCLA_09001 [Thraustotheca clavata]|uniref:Uncharacterized protein n=1 Tax=Thraustotheca clavata TaxID=74557 RepID=A0A1V9Z080_9STRA|nr:hypothetical protein THRCLA_09001 [Thraustotheca clavata]
MSVKYMLFDMDGLLLDTERVYSEVTNEILSRFGKTFDWSVKSRMMGVKEYDAAKILIEAYDLDLTPEAYLIERNAMHATKFPFCKPLPGVLKLIKHLKKHNIPICVATSSHRKAFELKSSRNQELFSLFDGNIVCGDDPHIKLGKPHPDLFLHAASTLNMPLTDMDNSSALVFEDAPSGVQAGLNAKMQVVWIPDANLQQDPLLASQCAQVLTSMEHFDPSLFGLKQNHHSMANVATQSRVLQSFRALGIVASDVPVALSRTGHVSVSIGKSFQVYDLEKLTPVAVSGPLPKKIRALQPVLKNNTTFAAVGRNIHVFERITQVKVLVGHQAPIVQLLAVGDVLFSIAEDKTLRMWSITEMKLLETIPFEGDFTPTFIVHPSTYLNKILIGSAEGSLQLWNVRTLKCLYTFKGWNSEVTTMAQGPAVDVVAIGLADGRIFIHNLKFDTTLMNFSQSKEGRVTTLSFRSDDKAPWLASGTTSGAVIIWNLESQRMESTIYSAHDGSIASAIFLPNEPLLLTSAGDNALKIWIFDQMDSSARLLKLRAGHKAPPTKIRYYGNDVIRKQDGTICQILSAGQDRSFRLFHTAREQQSQELSQGPLFKRPRKLNVPSEDIKLPPILNFAAMETREKDWANVVTCHEVEIPAYVWTLERKSIGKKVLQQFDSYVMPGSEEHQRRLDSKATAVTISSCGNFALVGSVGGAIYKYNMQSGEKRGSYPTAATPKAALIRSLTMPGASYKDAPDLSLADKHKGSVTGVVVDAINSVVVTSSMDHTLKFWNFATHACLDTIDLGSPVTHLQLHKENNLIVAACDDFVLRVIDIQTRKLVRRFTGHTHWITDVCFSPDARWLLSSSSDGSVRVWDLPTGKCIDFVKFKHAVTSITMSPTGEFIGTTHVGHVGIFLWANRSYFETVFVDSEPKEPVLIGMPVPLSELEVPLEHQVVSGVDEAPVVNEATPNTYISPLDKTSADMITLSTAPKAMWQSLFNLELIKKRNKPTEAPKAPEKAPFFLPTIRKDDVHPTFEKTKPVDEKTKQKDEKKEEDDVVMEGWGDSNDVAWGDEDDAEEDKEEVTGTSSRIGKSTGLTTSRSKLAMLLIEASSNKQPQLENDSVNGNGQYSTVVAYLQNLSASGVDVELSTLCMGDFDNEGKEHLGYFLDCMLEMLDQRIHFQVVQVYLNRFLKVHEDILVSDQDLLEYVGNVAAKQQEVWEHLQNLLHNNLCLVQYFSKMQM